MNELISKLNFKIKELGKRNFFNPPATISDIEHLEKTINLTLPNNLKDFYLNANGGFFADNDWSIEDLDDKSLIGTIRWNSNYILSIEDIIKSYISEESSMLLCDIQEQELTYETKLLPFLHTSGQEMLILDLSDLENKLPVLDAFHEVNYNEWGILHESFESFLITYIEKEGNINTIAATKDKESEPTFQKSIAPKKSIFSRIKTWWRKIQIDAYLTDIANQNKKKS